jgi:hypothetical protein
MNRQRKSVVLSLKPLNSEPLASLWSGGVLMLTVVIVIVGKLAEQKGVEENEERPGD